MCQVSAYVTDGEKEELFRENVTKMVPEKGGYSIETLFEGKSELLDVTLQHIDFLGGRIVFSKKSSV